MRKIIFFTLFLGFLGNSFAQKDQEVMLVDRVRGDNFYNGKIGDTPITMYLHFPMPFNPSFGSIYQRACAVSGWYYIDKTKKKMPLIGVMSGIDNMKLYVPKDEDHNNQLGADLVSWDSVLIYDLDDRERTLEIQEELVFTSEGGQWKKGSEKRPVQGIDFRTNYRERNILLEVAPEVGEKYTLDIKSLIQTQAQIGSDELVGMNGWGETEIRMIEHTFVEDDLNVLVEIAQTGSCNTDRSLLMWISVAHQKIQDFGVYKVANCQSFSLAEDKSSSGIWRIFAYGPDGKKSENQLELGSFEIKDSRMIILEPWDENFILPEDWK